MNPIELKERTIQFAAGPQIWLTPLQINVRENDSRQVARSSCSVASNYRAALRGNRTRTSSAKLPLFWKKLTKPIFGLKLRNERRWFRRNKLENYRRKPLS